MARNIKSILEELFRGQDAALTKYAKVRSTQYEMNLWRKYGLPLSEVAGQAKVYFAKRFLPEGQTIAGASKKELAEAFDRLDHAVKDGCHGRCLRLVEELNEALIALELAPLQQPEKFLNWLTFDYHVNQDYNGQPVREPDFGFEIRIFHDAENRKDFWRELQVLLKDNRMMSMADVFRIVHGKRKLSKQIKD